MTIIVQKQKTLVSPAVFEGVALNSGEEVVVKVLPADDDTGYVFRRVDFSPNPPEIRALHSSFFSPGLYTALQNADGVRVILVEHLLAALALCDIDNAVIELSSEEVAIMDGSACNFVEGFLASGIQKTQAERKVLEILTPVSVQEGLSTASLEPCDHFELHFVIDFPKTPVIGFQEKHLVMEVHEMVEEIASARTFCEMHMIDTLKGMGYGKGASLDNLIVADSDDIINPGGLRYSDEFVRHKMLDAVGDLALAGYRVRGKYSSFSGGHQLTASLLKELFSSAENYRVRSLGEIVDGSLTHSRPLNSTRYGVGI